MKELMNEFDLTDDLLEQKTQEYEKGTWELGDSKIYTGSHYDVAANASPPPKAPEVK